MARIGGRAARWAVATSAAATALLVAAGVTASDRDVEVQPASVDAVAAPSTTAASTTASSTPTPTAPPSTLPSVSAVPAPAGTSTPAAPSLPPTGTPSPSAAPGTTAAATGASVPSTAIVPTAPVDAADYPLHPGATADAPSVAFIGDSWTYGTGATDRVGYAYLTGRLLGWTYRVLGIGGSGYVQKGAGTPFDQRIAAAVVGNPDVVVIQGSINEFRSPPADLPPAVAETLTRLVRAAGPDTTVVVLGASYVPVLPTATVDRINDVLRAEAARQGLQFVDVAAEGWSAPTDSSIWFDSAHVNDVGARQIAERLAPVLRAVVDPGAQATPGTATGGGTDPGSAADPAA